MTAANLPPDYLDAMERHWLDAELLFHLTPPSLANADQLYGLSAECGLKALMRKWGMQLDHNNVPAHPLDRKHADLIWDRYTRRPRPFDDWSIHHRYASRSYFQQTVVEGHMRGASIVKKLVADAKILGELP
jgi:hypothetical protein